MAIMFDKLPRVVQNQINKRNQKFLAANGKSVSTTDLFEVFNYSSPYLLFFVSLKGSKCGIYICETTGRDLSLENMNGESSPNFFGLIDFGSRYNNY